MTRRTAAAAILFVFFTAAIAGQPADPSKFRFERGVAGAAREVQRLPVDVPLLARGKPFTVARHGSRLVAEDGLSDLRFFDQTGQEVPHLLIPRPRVEPVWLQTTVLPLAVTEKTSGFEADLGAAAQVDRVSVEGLRAPFLKRLTLEASGDRERWTMLAPEGTLFDLPADGLRQTEIEFTPGPYRFLRVVWDDTNSGRAGVPPVVRVRRAPDGPAPPLSSISAAGVERRPSEPGRSRYRVRLPGSRLPIVALRLEVGGGHVFRTAYVTEQRVRVAEAVPVEIGRGTLARVVRGGAAAAALRIPVTPPLEAELDLVIEDEDNPPLDVTGVQLEVADLPWIYVESKGRAIVARYGNKTAQAPSYDLEAARDTIDINAVPAGAWEAREEATGQLADTPPEELPAVGAAIDASAFRYTREIPEGGAGLVALTVDAAALAHSRGPGLRFDDVRIVDASSRQIPYLVERRDEPMPIELTIEPGTTRVPGVEARSVYRITLPYSSLPDATLVLTTSSRVFRRMVFVAVEHAPNRRQRDYYFETMGSRTWQGANRETPAPELPFSIPRLNTAELYLVVDEGDNTPLPITGARLLLPSYRLRFFQPADTPLRLVYGRQDLSSPEYDLALLAPQVMGAEAREISAASESGAVTTAAVTGLVSPRLFWTFLGVAVAVLLGLLVRLVRQTGQA